MHVSSESPSPFPRSHHQSASLRDPLGLQDLTGLLFVQLARDQPAVSESQVSTEFTSLAQSNQCATQASSNQCMAALCKYLTRPRLQ